MRNRFRVRNLDTGLYLLKRINPYKVPGADGGPAVLEPVPEWRRIPEDCATFILADAESQVFRLSVHPTNPARAGITRRLDTNPN